MLSTVSRLFCVVLAALVSRVVAVGATVQGFTVFSKSCLREFSKFSSLFV